MPVRAPARFARRSSDRHPGRHRASRGSHERCFLSFATFFFEFLRLIIVVFRPVWGHFSPVSGCRGPPNGACGITACSPPPGPTGYAEYLNRLQNELENYSADPFRRCFRHPYGRQFRRLCGRRFCRPYGHKDRRLYGRRFCRPYR